MANQKLTKRVVDAFAKDPAGKDVIHFDAEVKRFGVRVKPSGTKSYVYQYRNKFNRLRRITIGRVTELTPEQARDRAKKLGVSVSDGADPSADRKAARNAITVGDLCDEYLAANRNRIKASTLTMDESRIKRHVKPLLGTRAVASLTPADMERFLRDVIAGKAAPKVDSKDKRAPGGQTTGGEGVASRTLGMLATILERAVRDGIIDRNPARKIARPKDNVYKPAFSFEAVSAVGKALRTSTTEKASGVNAIRFLVLTGTRRMEALTLQWKTVDEAAQCMRFEDTKSGRQIRPIGRAALDHLGTFKPKDAKPEDFVFPGLSDTGYFVGLPKVWGRVAARAGIDGVSIHGLRHWFASAATALNYSELTIAGLLGHTVKGVTARYATAPDSSLLAAADAVSQRIAEALDAKK